MLVVRINNKAFLEKKDNSLLFSGPAGSLKLILAKGVKIFFGESILIIQSSRIKYLKLYSSLIKQKIKGVMQCFRGSISLKGVGYKFIFKDNINNFDLKVGFSNFITIGVPKTKIKIVSFKKNRITFKCNDLVVLTKFTSFIRNFKKPGIYKDKGLFLDGEQVKLKDMRKSNKW